MARVDKCTQENRTAQLDAWQYPQQQFWPEQSYLIDAARNDFLNDIGRFWLATTASTLSLISQYLLFSCTAVANSSDQKINHNALPTSHSRSRCMHSQTMHLGHMMLSWIPTGRHVEELMIIIKIKVMIIKIRFRARYVARGEIVLGIPSRASTGTVSGLR
jgi:hypothetical protein